MQHGAGWETVKIEIIEELHRDKWSGLYVRCRCHCGNEFVTRRSAIKYGHTKSCGCLQKQWAKTGLARLQHGCARRTGWTPEYRAYVYAKSRCENPHRWNYPSYGGRGIEFRFASFSEFYAELGEKPQPKRNYSLDRIDNDGHYEVGNVRWTTASEQRINQRRCYV